MSKIGDNHELTEEPTRKSHNFMERFIKSNKDLVILLILNLSPMCGLDLIKEIFSLSGILLSQGAVYPILYSFEEKHIIEAKHGKGDLRAKIYHITPNGRKIAHELSEDFFNTRYRISSIIHAINSEKNCLGSDHMLEVIGMELENNPNNWKTWATKAEISYSIGTYKIAIRCCDKSLTLNPDNVHALITKGNALNKLGNHEDAAVAFAKAKELEYNGQPKHP